MKKCQFLRRRNKKSNSRATAFEMTVRESVEDFNSTVYFTRGNQLIWSWCKWHGAACCRPGELVSSSAVSSSSSSSSSSPHQLRMLQGRSRYRGNGRRAGVACGANGMSPSRDWLANGDTRRLTPSSSPSPSERQHQQPAARRSSPPNYHNRGIGLIRLDTATDRPTAWPWRHNHVTSPISAANHDPLSVNI